MDLAPILDCARSAASAAASIHRLYAGRVEVGAWTEKGTADFVTHVDREAEAEIISRIRSSFPDHGIMAEEESTGHSGSSWTAPAQKPGWTWIVDPLDGTTNYLHGYPMYSVSIAASLDGVLQAGVVLNSLTGEAWYATRGGGSFRASSDRVSNEGALPVRVSGISQMKQALIGTGFPFKALHLLPEYLTQFDRVLRNSSGVRRAGSAALDLCHLASGMFDGFWELSLQPWDVAAGALIVREAGGVITTMEGSSDVVATGSILAGNAVIYKMLADVLRTPHAASDYKGEI